jgi:hypothetical protein
VARFRGLPRVRCPAVAGQAGAAGIPPRTRRADAADTISVRVGHRGAGYRRVAGDTSRRPGPGRSGAHRIGSERNQPTPHTCVAARRIVAGLARGAARNATYEEPAIHTQASPAGWNGRSRLPPSRPKLSDSATAASATLDRVVRSRCGMRRLFRRFPGISGSPSLASRLSSRPSEG